MTGLTLAGRVGQSVRSMARIGEATGVGTVNSFSRFWEMGEKAVWIGQTPDGKPPLIGFWHVVAFAWICNLAMWISRPYRYFCWRIWLQV